MDRRAGDILLDLMMPAICGQEPFVHGLCFALGEREKRSLRWILKKVLARAKRRFINGHEAYKVLDTDWFCDYLRQRLPLWEIFGYVCDGQLWKRTSFIFVRELVVDVRSYAADRSCRISETEEMALRNFFRMLIKTVRDILKYVSEGCLLPQTAHMADKEGSRTAFLADTYQEALTDQKKYLSLVRKMLELGGQEDWTKRKFGEYPWEILETHLEIREVAWDFYLNRDENSVREWMDRLAGELWEHYASFYLFCRLKRFGVSGIHQETETWIRQYFEKYIESANIKGSIVWKTDSSMSYQLWRVEPLILFASQFGYSMSKTKAKELLFRCAYTGDGSRTGKDTWLPERYLTKEEIREQVISNLMTEDLKGDVMRWHIRYCMDHHIEACTPVILKTARNPIRNTWVRKEALAYICKTMDIHAVCRDILPGLRGELFFFVAESFRDTGSPDLADLIWNYGERYSGQKLRCDICLVHMQDRRGVESLRRHMQRRNGMPPEPAAYELAEAVRGIRRAELADELEKFVRAANRTGFRDNPENSLLDASLTALAAIACDGEEEMNLQTAKEKSRPE